MTPKLNYLNKACFKKRALFYNGSQSLTIIVKPQLYNQLDQVEAESVCQFDVTQGI